MVDPIDPNVRNADPQMVQQILQNIQGFGPGGNIEPGVLKQVQDMFQTGRAQADGVDLQGQAPVGSQPATADPKQAYNHQAQQTKGTYFVPLTSDQANIKMGGTVLSPERLTRIMDESKPELKPLRDKIIKENKLAQNENGQWVAPVAQPSAGHVGDVAPGLKSTSAGLAAGSSEAVGASINGTGGLNDPAAVAQSSLNFLNRSSWLLPMSGFMSGGVVGLGAGVMTAGALKKTARESGAAGNSGLALTSSGLGSKSSSLMTYAAMGSVGGLMGLPGLANNCRSIMNSHAREWKDDAMIGMIDTGSIPIEDLIFMFMAHMADKFEEKLREKMREAATAEQLQEKRERRDKKADMAGGMATGVGALFGPVGMAIGGLVGQGIKMGAMKQNQIEAGLNGNMKSSTVLMSEVQMLMHKWKQLNEMLSNLMKAMHDMAMTPIRNIR
jgi:hypothetical protein